MSNLDSTLKMLGVPDTNIHAYESRMAYRGNGNRRKKYRVIFAELSYHLTKYPKCHHNELRPNGHKLTHIRFKGVSDTPIMLDLNKQR